MPRKIRSIIPNIPHHVIQRGNNKQNVFFDDADKNIFLTNLRIYSKKQKVLVGAYCLMTNHFHLLLYPDSSDGFIRLMKYISQLYTQYFNKKYNRTGKLWENRYKLTVVDPESEWILVRYIERNPVRAGITKFPEKYEYPSARFNLYGDKNEIVTKDIISEEREGYQEFMSDQEADTIQHLEKIKVAIQQEKAIGNVKFIKELEERFKTSFVVRKRGRPLKGK